MNRAATCKNRERNSLVSSRRCFGATIVIGRTDVRMEREAARFKFGRRLTSVPGHDACASSRPTHTFLALALALALSRRVTTLPRASRLADAFRLLSAISPHKDSAVWRCKSSCERRNSLMSGKLPPHQHDATSPESR